MHLKEVLAIQALLSENRIDEFKDFIDKNNYLSAGSQNFAKLDLSRNSKNNVLFMFRIIENNENNSSKFSLILLYKIKNKDGETSRDFKSIDERNTFKSIILKSLDIGTVNLSGFNNMVRQISEKTPKNIKIIDRYNVLIGGGDKWTPYRASNTSQTDISTYSFFGPGKTSRTDLKFLSKETESGYGFAIRINSYYGEYGTKDGEYENSIDKEPFNLSFFMGLENLNDRIWSDN